jgi:hypothetical protein
MAFAESKDTKDSRDYASWRQERRGKSNFGINVSTGDAVGFSGIPGKASYTFHLGERKKGKQFVKETEGPVATTDGPTPAPGPKPKPKPVKGKDATTADVEAAVSKGFITPEEATGGEWGKDMGLSKTYQRKSAANAAANGGTNVGKQFTSVRAGQPIPDQSNGAINYDKAPDNRPGVGAVNLDDVK